MVNVDQNWQILAAVGGSWSLLFGTWVWLLRRVAAGKLVPGKMHDARVGDARREAEIYKEMATTSLDALREQGRHTADTLVDIKGLILALAAQRGTS